MTAAPVVVLGSGLAGYSVARELRKLDADARIVVVSRDDASSYAKPTLSNALAAGLTPANLVSKSADDVRRELRIDVLARTAVLGFDTAARTVATDAGPIAYGALVLAVGADPIRLTIAGDGAGDVLVVNDLDDYVRFRARLDDARERRGGRAPRVLVMGGGLIGTELANDLVASGHAVDVVDLAPRLLGRLLPEEGARRVQEALEKLGARLHLRASVTSIERRGDARVVALSNGEELEVDVVLSAVGLAPRTTLAVSAGLEVRRGVVVDRRLATSAAGVFALGDCAEVDGLVLPFVQPLLASARALARTLAGTPTAVRYPAMPVVVKTPAMPVVVSPPRDFAGAWSVDEREGGIAARFDSPAGTLTGFALVGEAVKERAAWVKRVPPVLA